MSEPVSDNSPQQFVMSGARFVFEHSGGAFAFKQAVDTIEWSVTSSPSVVFDLSRSLLDTTCKTILRERNYPDCDSLKMKDLLKATFDRVPLAPKRLPEGDNANAHLQTIISGLDSVIQAITDLRNTEGAASHGKPIDHEPLDVLQAEFVARAADSVIAFLYKCHKGYFESPITPRPPAFEDYPEFNDYIDEVCEPIQVFDLDYRPSEVLFYVDQEAYRDKFAQFEGELSASQSEGSLSQ